MRWGEEVELLDEEMRWTLESFAYKSRWWASRTTSTIPTPGSISADYAEGFRAYALSQAAVSAELYQGCITTWSKGANEKSKKAAMEDIDEDDD